MSRITICDLSAGKSAPGANTDILEAANIVSRFRSGNDFQVPSEHHGATVRIQACFQNSTIVKVVDDTDTALLFFNAVAVGAEAMHIFELIVSKDRTYNVQIATDGIVRCLHIVLVVGDPA